MLDTPYFSKGVGFYGVVMKVKEKTGNFYAMKVSGSHHIRLGFLGYFLS